MSATASGEALNPDVLSERDEAFCRHYITCFKVAPAMVAAGFSETTAHSKGSTYFRKPLIQKRIQELMQERLAPLSVQADRITAELCAVGFSRITDVLDVSPGGDEVTIRDLNDLPDSTLAAVAEIKAVQGNELSPGYIQVKMHPKLPALELLAKSLGMLKETKQSGVSFSMEFDLGRDRS